MKNKNILILIIFLLFLSSCREEVVHLKSELEANRVMLGLRMEGINARKSLVAKEWVIDVPGGSLTEALKIMEEKRIFREESEELDENNQSEMFSSRQEKEVKTNKIISRNISNTLRILPDVLDARVHIYQQTMDSFSFDSQKDKRSASVLIIAEDKNAITIEEVKEIVSQGGGLDKKSVSVVIVESEKQKKSKNAPKTENNINKTDDLIERNLEDEDDIFIKYYRQGYLFYMLSILIVPFIFVFWIMLRKKRINNSDESLIIDSLIKEENEKNE